MARITNQAAFNQLYKASLPPEVLAVFSITDPGARYERCFELAAKGRLIDEKIMNENWDPWIATTYRESEGYHWVDSLLTHYVNVVPDIQPQGPQPAGTIKVSLDSDDYPAYKAPPSPVPPSPVLTSFVGKAYLKPDGSPMLDMAGRAMFAALPPASSSLHDGEVYTKDPRGAFQIHSFSMFTCWFTPVPTA